MRSYDEYKELVNNNLLKYIPSIDDEAKTLRESMEYSLKVGGKRVRPILLLAACEFAGGDINEALPYACALEFIHTYSLIHDDLPCMDNDDLRRGQPTNHKVYGDDIATLAGDGLLNSAAELMYSELVKCKDADKIKNHAAAGYEIMSRSGVRGMIGGQVADVINENKKGTKELVHFIEEHKTGDLITAGVLAGLDIAGANVDVKNDFEQYAMNLGIAFQVLDDILDFEGDSKLIGKTLGKDIDQDKCNFVCIHGLDAARTELHRLTNEAVDCLEKYGNSAAFFSEFAARLENRNK
ncbi:MAG: polyprenyl synthetase family protein [Clostridiales bacterium]|nr:polyprenyl synthetase family protein [Candidatus Crickella equi]